MDDTPTGRPLWQSDDGLADLRIEVPRWLVDAECREIPDPERFFPSKGEQGERAKRLCRWCPVRAQCLDWTLAHERGLSTSYRFGVLAGLSPGQRTRIEPL